MTDHQQNEKELVEKAETGSLFREYTGKMAIVISILTIVWSLFQIYAAGLGAFNAITLRGWHVLFLLVVVFLLYPARKKNAGISARPSIFDVLLIVLSVAAMGYLLSNYQDVVLRGGYLMTADYVFGALGILVVFEGARRVVGNLAILALVFLLYNFFGPFVPGPFGHGGFSINRVIDYLFWGSEGIFGIATGVSATFVFLFILFGSFLKISGFSQFINDLALTIAGRSPGGPAKVAVLASGLMGMINGSALANVATTGAITIPLMKQNGYRARFAAAVEAVASTGGQFAPPIMGAVGFVMAEYLGVPYVTVLIAAIIPAILYYLTLIMVVHFEAKKLGLKGISKENIPAIKNVLKKQGHLLIPLIVLLGMLFMGYTAVYAGIFSIFATVASSWIRKETRMKVRDIFQALEEGAKGAVGVAVACAIIGVIIGTVSLTGVGLTFGNAVMDYTNGSLLLAGVLVMLMSVVLGMGVPGVAAYVVVATVGAPVLIDLGVMPLAAHMFVLIYASLSNITPPVALASYIGAGIAGTDQHKVSMTAMKLGLTGFILPFFFIYEPALLLGETTITKSIIPVLTAIVGTVSIAAGLQGWFLKKASLIQRTTLFIIGLLMIAPNTITDFIGILFLLIITFWQWKELKAGKLAEV